MNELFRRLACRTAELVGTAWAFIFALLSIFIWLTSGPMFRFSDTWQLVINTGTTIVTFLMVFLIQNSQNRDAKAMHLKLDELIRATRHARNSLVDLERLSDAELRALEDEFHGLHQRALQHRLHREQKDVRHPHHDRRATAPGSGPGAPASGATPPGDSSDSGERS